MTSATMRQPCDTDSGTETADGNPASILADPSVPRGTLNIAYTGKSEHDALVIWTSSFGFPSDLGISCFDLHFPQPSVAESRSVIWSCRKSGLIFVQPCGYLAGPASAASRRVPRASSESQPCPRSNSAAASGKRFAASAYSDAGSRRGDRRPGAAEVERIVAGP